MVFAALLACIFALTPLPASARTDWDPDDVAGPFDLRRVEVHFASPTSLSIRVSFHDGFSVGALPWSPDFGTDGVLQQGVLVDVTGVDGYFLRRAGRRVAFIYGDFGSSCGASYPDGCERGVVTRPSPDVLQVTMDTPGPWEYSVRVETYSDDGRVSDMSADLKLGLPPRVPA
jgi:hypothetical protein